MTPLRNPDLFWWIATPMLLAAVALVVLTIVFKILTHAYDRRAEAAEREAAELHGERVARHRRHM
ncbi:hypothetical protein [Nesterenkonia sp. CF4.4]|uniref:hypothetical protein n=1 Tax=Nesterenkonia sp. CF4.4 TaxID=3373079 RepID=UPI003EE50A80